MRNLLLLSLWFAHFNVICEATERRKRQAVRLVTPVEGDLPAIGDSSTMEESTSANRFHESTRDMQPFRIKHSEPFYTKTEGRVLYSRRKVLMDGAPQRVQSLVESLRRRRRSLDDVGRYDPLSRKAINDGEELGLQYADAPYLLRRSKRRQRGESRTPRLRGELLLEGTSGEDEPHAGIRIASGRQLKDELYHHAKQNGLIVLGPDPGAIPEQSPFARIRAPSPRRARRYENLNYEEEGLENFPQNADYLYGDFESRRQRNNLNLDFPSYDAPIQQPKSRLARQRNFLDNNFPSYSDEDNINEQQSLQQNSINYDVPSYGYDAPVQQMELPESRQKEQYIYYGNPSDSIPFQRSKLSKRGNRYPSYTDYKDISYDARPKYAAELQTELQELPQETMYDAPDLAYNEYDKDNEKTDALDNNELLANLQSQLQNMQQVLASYNRRSQHRRKRKNRARFLRRGRATF